MSLFFVILNAMKTVDTSIKISELSDMATKMYGNLVKAVVDLKKNILVVDAEMHAMKKVPSENGSEQYDLWD